MFSLRKTTNSDVDNILILYDEAKINMNKIIYISGTMIIQA